MWCTWIYMHTIAQSIAAILITWFHRVFFLVFLHTFLDMKKKTWSHTTIAMLSLNHTVSFFFSQSYSSCVNLPYLWCYARYKCKIDWRLYTLSSFCICRFAAGISRISICFGILCKCSIGNVRIQRKNVGKHNLHKFLWPVD